MLRDRFEAPNFGKLLANGFGEIEFYDNYKFQIVKSRLMELFKEKYTWGEQSFNLTNVTVIFQLFNRPHYFGPIFLEFSRLVTGCKFLISDASQAQSRTFHQKIIAAAQKVNPTLDIEYFELDEKISAYKNLGILINKVSTKYCIKFDDDDFLNPAALLEAREELDQKNDVVAVHGRMLNFMLEKELVTLFPAIRTWATSDDIVQNLNMIALRGGSNWQIMVRTKSLLQAFSRLQFTTPEAPDMLFDHLLHLYLAFDGKIEMTSGIFGFVRRGQRDTNVVQNRYLTDYMLDRYHYPDFFTYFTAFKDHLYQKFISSGLPEGQATKFSNNTTRFVVSSIIHDASSINILTRSRKKDYFYYIDYHNIAPEIVTSHQAVFFYFLKTLSAQQLLAEQRTPRRSKTARHADWKLSSGGTWPIDEA